MTFQFETNFNTKNIYKLETVALKDKVDTTFFKDAGSFQVYELETKTIVSGNFSKEESVKNYGVASDEFISAVKKNPHLYQGLIKSSQKENPIHLLKKEFKSYLKEYGVYNNLAQLVGEDKKEMSDFFTKNAYLDCDNSEYEFMQFVKNKNDLRVWKDSKNNLYTEPFVLNYISANLDNGVYHLEELIEYLMTRDDVGFITDSERNYSNDSKLLKCPLNGNEYGVDKIIADIPGYNAEDGRDETICLVYYPNSEAIEKLTNWEQNKTHPKIWNIENYIVRELLQCDIFSKEPVFTTEPVVPKRKFKS